MVSTFVIAERLSPPRSVMIRQSIKRFFREIDARVEPAHDS
jgi:hypothetical protein